MNWDGLSGLGRFRWTLVPYEPWDDTIVGDCYILEVLNDQGTAHRLGAAEGLANARRWVECMDKGRDPRWNRYGSKPAED